MSRYENLARQHWERWLPNRLAQISDPARFFRQLGTEVEEEIATLSADLASQESSAPTYLQEVGRLNRVRQQAEERVLAERIFLAPEVESPTPANRPR